MPDTFYDESSGLHRNTGMPSVPSHTPEPDQPSYPKSFGDPDVDAVEGRQEPVDVSDSATQAPDAQPAPEPPAEPEPAPEAEAEPATTEPAPEPAADTAAPTEPQASV